MCDDSLKIFHIVVSKGQRIQQTLHCPYRKTTRIKTAILISKIKGFYSFIHSFVLKMLLILPKKKKEQELEYQPTVIENIPHIPWKFFLIFKHTYSEHQTPSNLLPIPSTFNHTARFAKELFTFELITIYLQL